MIMIYGASSSDYPNINRRRADSVRANHWDRIECGELKKRRHASRSDRKANARRSDADGNLNLLKPTPFTALKLDSSGWLSHRNSCTEYIIIML